MKLSRNWMSDYVDLGGLSDEEIGRRMTEIGHAIEALETHGNDAVFDAEITTNRVDAMSHFGMARELAGALGRKLVPPANGAEGTTSETKVTIRIDEPEMCSRFSGIVIRGVTIKPSPAHVAVRLEAVGLRPINNVVDVTNYVMLALGHPLHAYDLAKLADKTIIVRRGNDGEKMRSLDGEMRAIDRDTVVISDARHAVGLGGIIGGEESEISSSTRDVLLECAWFNPSYIRRTARRLGLKTDASYRFERRVDPNGTLASIDLAASMIVELAGGTREKTIDVVAAEHAPKTVGLRSGKLDEQSAGIIGEGYARELFTRLGFGVANAPDGLDIKVPTYRGDIFEEMDLIEEVLRFYGLNKIPASLPRLTTGDVRQNPVAEAEDKVRGILVGSGMSEVITYSFINAEQNALFSSDEQLLITNALTENLGAMRLSLLPGLLEAVAFNRSYGTRDGALFEVGRTYRRGNDVAQTLLSVSPSNNAQTGVSVPHAPGIVERRTIGIVMFGTVGTHWGDTKRPVDFFDAKGLIEEIAAKFHVELSFAPGDDVWLKAGRRAVARTGDRKAASVGFLASEILQRFGIKGEVLAAEIDLEALLASTEEWKMAPVARYPGVPMILAVTHGRDVEYSQIISAIRSLDVPFLHEVGLRDRFVPEGDENTIKTTLGMWYQAFDRSLTQEEVAAVHQNLASRVASLMPVKIL